MVRPRDRVDPRGRGELGHRVAEVLRGGELAGRLLEVDVLDEGREDAALVVGRARREDLRAFGCHAMQSTVLLCFLIILLTHQLLSFS